MHQGEFVQASPSAPERGAAAAAAEGCGKRLRFCQGLGESVQSTTHILRIRLRFYKTSTAYRETPQSGPKGLPAQLCIKQLYAALWTATPAKPFRGAFLAAPFGGGALRPCCPLWGKCRASGKGGVVGIFELFPFNEPHPLSQPCRFRSAVKSASSPNGGAKSAAANSPKVS